MLMFAFALMFLAAFMVTFTFLFTFFAAFVLAFFFAFSLHCLFVSDNFLCHVDEFSALSLVEVFPVGKSFDHLIHASHHLRAHLRFFTVMVAFVMLIALLFLILAALFLFAILFVFLFVAA